MTERPDEEPACEDCFVAYLDILGYREHVAWATSGEFAADKTGVSIRLLDAVVRIASTLWKWGPDQPEFEGMAGRVFSDTICISIPARPGSSVAITSVLVNCLSELTSWGYFIRGALVRDGHFDNGRIVFSPALIRGYDIERTQSIYPRVVLSPEVTEDYAAHANAPTSDGFDAHCAVWRDWDGWLFVNYLRTFYDDPTEEKAAGKALLDKHREVIVEALNKHHDKPSHSEQIRVAERVSQSFLPAGAA